MLAFKTCFVEARHWISESIHRRVVTFIEIKISKEKSVPIFDDKNLGVKYFWRI